MTARLRTVVAIGVAVALAAAGLGIGADASADSTRVVDGRVGDWIGRSTRLGGTWQYDRGELVYQDHLYDDLGADTGQRAKQHGTVGPPMGDVRYPTKQERFGANAADLFEVRLAVENDDLWLLSRLNTLLAPDTTVVAFAFDTDGDAGTGGGAWPHQAGFGAAGADVVVTLWGGGGSVTRLPGGLPERLPAGAVAVSVDNDANAIEARVPLAALGLDAGAARVVRTWAASGLWDSAAETWQAIAVGPPTETSPGNGSPNVTARAFNVAFRPDEVGSYLEEDQAAALKDGDITPFGLGVDLDALRRHATRPYVIEPGHFYVGIVDEGVAVTAAGEGLSYDGEQAGRFTGVGGAALKQTFDFYGRFQPYGLYLPSTYDGVRPLPAALALHGIGGSHSTYNTQPGFLRDMGEGDGTAAEPPLMLITPLARGSSFYADWGEADVQARFPMDDQRLFLTGYSMGGYGVYRLASLYPDRFAAAVAWAGYTGEFTGSYLTGGSGTRGKANIGDPVDTLENLGHLPLLHLGGTNDEIVPTSGQYAAPRRLAELGSRSRYDLYAGYEHFSFALVDDWKQARRWLGDQRREQRPREIVLKFSDGWTAPGLAAQLGLRHGNAWWLRNLVQRSAPPDGFELASASATSWAVPEPVVSVLKTTGRSTEPTPNLQLGVSWVPVPGASQPIDNRIDLSFVDVRSATVAVRDAGLDACGLDLRVTTDGPVSLRLAGQPLPSTVSVLGPPGTTWSRSAPADLTIGVPASGPVAVRCPPSA
jgi:hypothetical protein